MADLNGFARRMKIRGAQVESGVNKAVQKVALAIDQAVVLATPVDTGRARSNWQVSLIVPILSTREPYAPGRSLGLSESANARAAIGQAKAIIPARKPEQEIHITNNLHYISDLNRGDSICPSFTGVCGSSSACRGCRC